MKATTTIAGQTSTLEKGRDPLVRKDRLDGVTPRRCTSDETVRRVRSMFGDWQDPSTPTDKYDFYCFLLDLTAEGRRWTYAEVSEVTGITTDVIRMRVDYMRSLSNENRGC